MARKLVKPKSTPKEAGLEAPIRKKKPRKKKTVQAVPFVGPEIKGLKIKEIALRSIDLKDDTFKYRVKLRVKDLVDSISTNGQQFPIVLRRKESGKYQVISGFRRLTAIQELGWSKVQAVVREDLNDDEQAARLSILENEARQTYNDLDRAYAIVAYRRMGKSGKEVETLFHIGRRQRQRLQTLTSFPDVLQEAVSDGRVTATNAVRLMQHIKLNPRSKLVAWLDWIIEHEATYKELNAALNKATSRNREQKPVELFAVGHKRGKKFLRLRPVTVDTTMSDSQKEALLKDLKLVMKFLEEL